MNAFGGTDRRRSYSIFEKWGLGYFIGINQRYNIKNEKRANISSMGQKWSKEITEVGAIFLQ